MSIEQEALKRAEEGEIRSKMLRQEPPDWAAMLRKLVAEREADRAAMREALEALEALQADVHPAYFADSLPRMERVIKARETSRAAITHLRQRLEGTT